MVGLGTGGATGWDGAVGWGGGMQWWWDGMVGWVPTVEMPMCLISTPRHSTESTAAAAAAASHPQPSVQPSTAGAAGAACSPCRQLVRRKQLRLVPRQAVENVEERVGLQRGGGSGRCCLLSCLSPVNGAGLLGGVHAHRQHRRNLGTAAAVTAPCSSSPALSTAAANAPKRSNSQQPILKQSAAPGTLKSSPAAAAAASAGSRRGPAEREGGWRAGAGQQPTC